MRRCFVPEVFLGALLACALFAMGFVASSSFQSPPHQEQQQSSAHSAENSGTQSAVAKVADANDRIADYTYWLTWLTFLTAISTVGLWYLTGRTLKHSRETAERQLRAYISKIKSDVHNVEIGKCPQAHVVYKNGGQTPAYDVSGSCGIGLVPWPFTGPIRAATPETRASKGVLGPGHENHLRVTYEEPITIDQMNALIRKKMAIVVVGDVTYRDAFGAIRTTNFLYYYGGSYGMNEKGVMYTANEGNDAN